ncbi:Integral membrane protein [Minicystis rosea]|nr:Integral membrane protein [Minicystis rosea]
MIARTQDELVAARTRDWQELDRLLAGGDGLQGKDGATISRVAALYRALCTDLMRARAARVTPDLSAYLDSLAARAHGALYGARPFQTPVILAFFTRDFPRALRANGRVFAIACALFFVPFVAGLLGALASEDFATRVLPAQALEQMARMHSHGFAQGRDAGADVGMAGFYVQHNIGIAFRCFSTGILFGIGSLFFLVYNGLMTGVNVGYVMAVGHGANIWTFMCSHAPFELGAIMIAGGAGLQMGYALVDTGGLTRVGSLRRARTSIVQQVLGAAVMLLIAALLEGFWSPSSLPSPVKWAASGVNTLLIVLYLALAGRERREPREQHAPSEPAR